MEETLSFEQCRLELRAAVRAAIDAEESQRLEAEISAYYDSLGCTCGSDEDNPCVCNRV